MKLCIITDSIGVKLFPNRPKVLGPIKPIWLDDTTIKNILFDRQAPIHFYALDPDDRSRRVKLTKENYNKTNKELFGQASSVPRVAAPIKAEVKRPEPLKAEVKKAEPVVEPIKVEVKKPEVVAPVEVKKVEPVVETKTNIENTKPVEVDVKADVVEEVAKKDTETKSGGIKAISFDDLVTSTSNNTNNNNNYKKNKKNR